MNVKTLTTAVMMGLWLFCAPARMHAQEVPGPGIPPPPIRNDVPGAPDVVPPPLGALPPGAAPAGLPSVAVPPSPSGLSDWITYKRGDCCVPGTNVPLYSEVYLRAGPSIPVGGNYLGRELQVGWAIAGGVRGLLFNPSMTSALVADLHIVNSNNSGISNGDPRVLNIFQKNATGTSTLSNVAVTVRSTNRTLVGLGTGREWFLLQPANAPGNHWRVGVDAGGRYGSESMQFNEIRHRTDTVAGLYAAAHTDFEVAYGRWFFSWGLRCEWAYTWSDILQFQSDVQEISALATFSVRY
jgi:hypothetical protein